MICNLKYGIRESIVDKGCPLRDLFLNNFIKRVWFFKRVCGGQLTENVFHYYRRIFLFRSDHLIHIFFFEYENKESMPLGTYADHHPDLSYLLHLDAIFVIGSKNATISTEFLFWCMVLSL